MKHLAPPWRWIMWTFVGAVLVALSIGLYLHARHQAGEEMAEAQWRASRHGALADIGSTRTLSIMPLVNWHTDDARLLTEAGVAYLVRTDTDTILLDLGFNLDPSKPSPLLHNMAALGIKLDDVDAVFLSHHHPDHAGGFAAIDGGTILFGGERPDLARKPVFTTVPLDYPTGDVQVIREPRRVLSGVASIGPIPRQLFLGWIEEQALAINLEGKGIVLVVGCGHQTVAKIIQRTKELFTVPIYAVVGDLHFPVPNGRLSVWGVDVQRRLASGSGPLGPIELSDVHDDIARLKELNLGLIALGGHDTHEDVLTEVERTFGNRYHAVRVGKAITF